MCHDHEHPQLAPGGKLIMNEVHRPGLVRSCGQLPILASFALILRFGVLFRSCRPISRYSR
jgi:hypothetical protein